MEEGAKGVFYTGFEKVRWIDVDVEVVFWFVGGGRRKMVG